MENLHTVFESNEFCVEANYMGLVVRIEKNWETISKDNPAFIYSYLNESFMEDDKRMSLLIIEKIENGLIYVEDYVLTNIFRCEILINDLKPISINGIFV